MPPTHMNKRSTTWAAGAHSAKSPGEPAPVALPKPVEVPRVTTLNAAIRSDSPNALPVVVRKTVTAAMPTINPVT